MHEDESCKKAPRGTTHAIHFMAVHNGYHYYSSIDEA